MKKILLLYLLFFGFLHFVRGQNNSNKSQKSPNVIIVLVDDMGYEDVGFNGCEDIPTPNIDKIASDGVKFTNAYVSYAVCGPSRAGIITGRYQGRFGFGRNPLFAPNDPEMGLPKTEETLAEALQKANYKSVAIGKWHLGAHQSLRHLNRGFDDFYGFLSGGHNYLPKYWTINDECDIKSQFDDYKTKLLRNITRVEEDKYLTDALSREAVNYIEKYKNEPFFMYLAYNAPHTPLQATEKYLNRFDSIQDSKRKTYAAMISAVDDGVGEILDKLDQLCISENTMVFFLSDNGEPERKNGSKNGVLRGGKGDVLEGGIRVPFAVTWPKKIPKGVVFDAPIISLDIFATVIAQLENPIHIKNKLDGVDLIPYILGESDSVPHEYLFWRKYDNNQYAIRNSLGIKIIGKNDTTKLFNLNTNISEDPSLVNDNEAESENLKKAFSVWEKQILNSVFLGLMQNKKYNEKYPDRFKKPE